jgi:hypothetical protein
VESGEWRVESGEWRVESGEWRVESGEWRVESREVESNVSKKQTAFAQKAAFEEGLPSTE